MRMTTTFAALLCSTVFCSVGAVHAQDRGGDDPRRAVVVDGVDDERAGPTVRRAAALRGISGPIVPGGVAPVLHATRVEPDERPEIDGVPDEAVWERSPVATEFTQFDSDPGAPATERTEVRLLYGDDALYVAFHAFDSAPDSVVGQLTRRDQQSYSDEVGIQIDSYYDRRTAFDFWVNPVGVKRDIFRFDDTNEDIGWDAVWEAAAVRTDVGWTAEFRIPYSQLRFRADPDQTWGINFTRVIARKGEMATWADVRRGESAIVSRFGELVGLVGLDQPTRLEVTPYTVARLTRAQGNPENPFFDKNDGFASVGADLKFGVTSDLTLNVTVNPDFGQIEADPAQVNLSAFEVFLPERRPFFVEGSNLFEQRLSPGDGDGANESLFYSRRIGRAPQGGVNAQGGYIDAADQTTILGAWKMSGKTAGGWSIGVLHAVTGEERATVAPGDGSDRITSAIEPFTNYGVARVAKDFRDGRSAIGLIGTVVNRDTDVADELALRRSAFTGGLDARHRFGNEEWELSGWLLGSHIRGSEAAIDRAQRSSARWFQRPDADHIEYDPTRTSLSGIAASMNVARIAGGHWRFATGFETRTPGFETNDLGYMREADYLAGFGYVGYVQASPQGWFRNYRVNMNGWSSFSYGGDRYSSGGNINGGFQLTNFWGGHAGVNYQYAGVSNSLLRGGPMMKGENALNGWAGINSDSRKPVRLNLGANFNHRGESGSWALNLSPNLTWRPSGRASLTAGAFWNRRVDDQQWVRSFGSDPATADYLFGEIDQTTVGLTARVDYAFTPNLSLQFYAQPFVSAGEYGDFKTVDDPLGETNAERWDPVEAQRDENGWAADLNGDGSIERWRNPDFNFRQFRSNTVLRWEYRPGSALFVVWAQGRNFASSTGAFGGMDDFSGLFDTQPDNIFMLKMSWWLNP